MNKCFLFDNDGTLVDSEFLCNLGLALMFEKLGIQLDPNILVKNFRGWKLALVLEALEREYEIKLADSFVSEYRAIVSNLFDKELRPIEGIKDVLESIDGAKAVVSSGPMKKIKHALELCGLAKYFNDNLYSSYDVGIWKPDPGIYLHAAKDMGYHPHDCVVIDDGPVGIQSGVAAGIKTYFYNPYGESCDLHGVTSFSSMKVLPQLLNEA